MARSRFSLAPGPVYRAFVLSDERGSVVWEGRTVGVRYRYTLELTEHAVRLLRTPEGETEPTPRDVTGHRLWPDEVVVEQAAFDVDAFRAAPFDEEVFAEARYILEKAREGWRAHLEVRNTTAGIDAALAALRDGQWIEHGASATEITYRYDADADAFVDVSVTTNPYTNERREVVRHLDEAAMRRQLEALSDEALIAKLRP